MVDRKAKAQIVETFQRSVGDTGSTEVQVALLSAFIQDITEHLKRHPKDKHTRRGLLNKVSQRKSLLLYLKKANSQRYLKLLQELGLRR
jgi:small subunit ribosomal protein S15